jgi:hypothetical protein
LDNYADIASIIALTMGASWASGINLYAAMVMLGLSAATGGAELPPGLEVLENPIVIGMAALMYVVEFFADKIPGVDTTWDTLHTFIRIPAGALMAYGAVGDIGPVMEISAAFMGGGLAAASHATKAGSRIVINSSPEPFTNWAASISEDVAVFGGLWAALHHPWLFLALLIFFILFVIWVLPKIWSAIKTVFSWLGRLFGGGAPPAPELAAEGPQSEPLPDDPTDEGDLDKLARLKELLDSGALTEEEFNREKAKILNPNANE